MIPLDKGKKGEGRAKRKMGRNETLFVGKKEKI